MRQHEEVHRRPELKYIDKITMASGDESGEALSLFCRGVARLAGTAVGREAMEAPGETCSFVRIPELCILSSDQGVDAGRAPYLIVVCRLSQGPNCPFSIGLALKWQCTQQWLWKT